MRARLDIIEWFIRIAKTREEPLHLAFFIQRKSTGLSSKVLLLFLEYIFAKSKFENYVLSEALK
jgi:hypothetical protein